MTRRRHPPSLAPGYMLEDLELHEVAGPPRYTSRTGGPVSYIAIVKHGDVVIGYLYANDEDQAAGWQSQGDATPADRNAAYPWVMRLRDAKVRGLAPSAALDELIGQGSDRTPEAATRAVGPRRSAAGLAALRELAGAAPKEDQPRAAGRGPIADD